MDVYHEDKHIKGLTKHSMKARVKKFSIYDFDDRNLNLIRDFYGEVSVAGMVMLLKPD